MRKKIDELILESLSFYTPLTIDQIILDLDHKEIKNIPEFNLDILEDRIKFFVKTKRVKVLKSNKRVTFIKLFPKRKPSLIGFLKELRPFKKNKSYKKIT